MKMMKKLSVLLLSFGMMLMLTAPALAVPSESFAVLNVKYAPNGSPRNGIEISLCKVADAVRGEDGKYTYTLTEDFAGSGINVNTILNGKQVTDPETNTDVNQQLLRSFGNYINERASDENPVRKLTATTANMAIGTDSESSDGVAQFTGLEDGLYLGYTNTVTTIDRTQYTAVPFLLNIPYVAGGVANNYITANMKFTADTLPLPVDPEPDEPIITPPITDDPYSPGPGPVGPTGPVAPAPAPAVDPAPVPPAGPAVEPAPVEEPVIDILPEEVPLASLPEEELPVEIEIPDAEVPLANLPQTGLLWWPVPLMASAGVACVGLGAYTKKRDRDA